MKRFFCKLTALLLAAVIPLGAWFAWVQNLPTAFDGSLMGSIRIKLDLVQNTPGPRVLLVGGSSVPYSISCEPVSAALGMPCLNLGATAYLGMEYYLSLLQPELREGDIVILAPEFSMYNNKTSYSTLWMALENDTDALSRVPLSYWPGMVGSYHIYAAQKLERHRLTGQVTSDAYASFLEFGFGPQGDIVRGHETNILEKKYNTQDTLVVTETMADAKVLRRIQQFGRQAAKKGATVYLTYAPFNRLAYQSSLEEADALQQRLEEETGLPFLGRLRDGILDEALFFDSNNHLNKTGQALRTQALLDDLSAAGVAPPRKTARF